MTFSWLSSIIPVPGYLLSMAVFNFLWLCLLLLITGLGESKPTPAGCTLPSLLDATQSELQAGLRLGCFTSVELVQTYIHRINEVNSKLNAVLQINPDALKIAERLDWQRQQGRTYGPLHGLPILVKDLIGTYDRMETAAGSLALVGSKVREDATVVANLRKGGAIILGKTSMSEWANARSSISSNGWNARGGQTYAAYHEEQDPSGSSSGSAVATDLGLAFAALGTETSGSIILPSEKSNIVGIKPTVGLTSRYMVIPVSEREDTIGPMARTVRDAAIVLQVIVGEDAEDNYTLVSPFHHKYPDYTAACNLTGLQDKRIGIPRNVIATLPNFLGSTADPIIASFERAVAVMEEAGATIVEDANFTAYEALLRSETPQRVVAADMLSGLADYLSRLTSNPNHLGGLEDVRNFTQHSPGEDFPMRDTHLWDMALFAGMNNTSPDFWPVYQQALHFGEDGGLLGALSRDGLDAVILPSCAATSVPGIIGTPVITVPFDAFPAGTSIRYNTRGDLIDAAPGIPLGISFLGPKWSEESLIAMAYAFEQRTLTRRKLHREVEPRNQLLDLPNWNRSSCG
ncbi:amidase signature domain-containing protein [Aspergillus cavernicola]|uniref:Amidase signature domain-containing protein n=1 Tax=Aspergillus cavernicola TaxID=176166 RepID=A0ABR4HQA7_9EURO